MTRVALYARTSTARHQSPEMQLAELNGVAAEHAAAPTWECWLGGTTDALIETASRMLGRVPTTVLWVVLPLVAYAGYVGVTALRRRPLPRQRVNAQSSLLV
jgi:hypothetical protein